MFFNTFGYLMWLLTSCKVLAGHELCSYFTTFWSNCFEDAWMSLLPIFHISAFMFYIWAIILVLNRRPITRVNIFGALLCSTFLMWSFSSTLVHLVIDGEQAYIWMNVSALGWASIPVASLWFYLAITDRKIIESKYFLSLWRHRALEKVY